MKYVEGRCPNCGACIQVDENKECCTCLYCRSSFKSQEALRKIELNKESESYMKLMGNNKNSEGK